MRQSQNEVNGFDYELQCWVKNGLVQRCGHPETMACGCTGRRLCGQRIQDVRKSNS